MPAAQIGAVTYLPVNLSAAAGSIAEGLRSTASPYGVSGMTYGWWEAYNDTGFAMFNMTPGGAQNWKETSVSLVNPGMIWGVQSLVPLAVQGNFMIDLTGLPNGVGSVVPSLLGSNRYRMVFTYRPGGNAGPIYWAKSVNFDIVANCTPVGAASGYRLSTTQIFIEWAPGASKVRLERTSDGVNWSLVVDNYVGLDYTDTVIPGTDYAYRMFAICTSNGNDYTSVSVEVEFPGVPIGGTIMRYARLRR